jgi:hypothetical protein
MDEEKTSHCYPTRFPRLSDAMRTLGKEPFIDGAIESVEARESVGDPTVGRVSGFLCGSFGPPCFHCGGVSEALCDFPLGDEGRTCDRPLCLECAPTIDADKNYCHDHNEHGRTMLLFPQPKRVMTPPGPAPRKRAKPLPKAPPESHRWRVRQGVHGHPPGAVLTDWMTQIEARLFATKVNGYVETWDEFVKLWRSLYPLAPRKK